MEGSPQPTSVICVNDRVLLEYSRLDDSVGFREGHHLLSVGDKAVGRVPCLAICKDKESTQVNFHGCDSGWTVALAGMSSVEGGEAKSGANISGLDRALDCGKLHRRRCVPLSG